LSVVGGIDGTINTASQPNITLVGSLVSLTSAGATFSQRVNITNGGLSAAGPVFIQSNGLSVTGGIAGTIVTPAQTNITSLGNLTSLNTAGLTSTERINISSGGLSAAGPVFIQSNGLSVTGGIAGTIVTPAQTNITSVGNLTSLNTAGLTSTQRVTISSGGLSVAGNIDGTIGTAAQPNITSLGTLTSLTTSGLLSAQALNVVAGATFGVGIYAPNLVTGVNGITGAVSLTSGSNITITQSGKQITIASNITQYTAPLATSSVTGVASFRAADFDVSTTGSVSLTGTVARTNASQTFTGLQVFSNGLSSNGITGTVLTPTQTNITAVGTLTSLNSTGLITTTAGLSANSINIASGATFNGPVRIFGDLLVSGGMTTTVGENVLIEDNFILLNSNATVAESGGIEVYRGSTNTNRVLRWNESTSTWQITNDGTNYVNIAAQGNLPIATASVTGVASFPNTDFSVSSVGAVSLTGNVARTHIGQSFSGLQVFSSGLSANGLTGTILTPAQTNITSLGTLTSLNTAGITSTQRVTISSGGLSVAGNIDGTIGTAAQPNITSLGTLTSLNSAGLTSTQRVTISSGGLSVAGNIDGTIGTAAQPNITSLGSLTTLTTAGLTSTQRVNVSAGGVVVQAGGLSVTGGANLTGGSTFFGDIEVFDGAFIRTGGLSVTGGIAGTILTPTQTNITSVGVLSGLSVNNGLSVTGGISVTGGANISGGGISVTGGIAGTLVTPAQTNITSLGTLTSLTTSGLLSAQALNVVAGATFGVGIYAPNLVTGVNGITGAVSITSGSGITITQTGKQITVASSISQYTAPLATSSVTGVASFPNADFSVSTVGAVSLTGNVARTHIGQSFSGLQVFSSGLSSNGITGTILTPSQTNITAVGTLTSLNSAGLTSTQRVTISSGGLSVAGNIDGTIGTAAQPNITSLGTLTSLNTAGMTSTQRVTISSGGLSVAGNIDGTIGTAAQPNITSLGTLTSLNAAGLTSSQRINVSSGGIVVQAGGLSVTGGANLTGGSTFFGDIEVFDGAFIRTGGLSVTGGIAGTLVTPAQTNITSVGTLSSLTVSGLLSTHALNVTAGATFGFDLSVSGNINATTKSFVIKHPTKPGMTLRYGSLEGPENGVYVRGMLQDCDTIELPEYWRNLVDENTITVNLTPIGSSNSHFVKSIGNNQVIVGSRSKKINCFYIVFGERKDVPKLTVEY
jgi:hypothetical protein